MFRLIHGDVMETKTTLNADVCEKLDVALVSPDIERFKVISNLPYNITTPFLASLLNPLRSAGADGPHGPERAGGEPER